MCFGYHTVPSGKLLKSKGRYKKWEPILPVNDHGSILLMWDWGSLYEFMRGISINYTEISSSSSTRRKKVFKYKHNLTDSYCYKITISNREVSIMMRGISPDISVVSGHYRYVKEPHLSVKDLPLYIRRVVGNVETFSLFEDAGISKSSVYKRQTRLMKNTSITDIFARYNGVSIIVLSDTNPFPDINTNCVMMDDGSMYHTKFISWCASFAKSVFESSDTIEIDASFKVTQPYVYYLITCVKNNNSIPIGFTIGPSESEELYHHAFEMILNVTGDLEALDKKYYLSDLGRGIIRVCKATGIYDRLFFCYRHFIQLFGSKSFFQPIISDLLYSKTQEEFDTRVASALYEIKEYVRGRGYDQYESHLKRFSKLTGYLLTPEFEYIRVNPVYFAHLVRFRRPNIPTCSNHIESMHRVLNSRVSGSTHFLKRIEVLIQYVNEKICNMRDRSNRNASAALSEIRRRVISMEESGMVITPNQNCMCREFYYTSALFGRDFSCVHRMKAGVLPPRVRNTEEISSAHHVESILYIDETSSTQRYSQPMKKKEGVPVKELLTDWGETFNGTKYERELVRLIGECTSFLEKDIIASSVIVSNLRASLIKEGYPDGESLIPLIRVRMWTDNDISVSNNTCHLNKTSSSDDEPIEFSDFQSERQFVSESEEDDTIIGERLSVMGTCLPNFRNNCWKNSFLHLVLNTSIYKLIRECSQYDNNLMSIITLVNDPADVIAQDRVNAKLSSIARRPTFGTGDPIDLVNWVCSVTNTEMITVDLTQRINLPDADYLFIEIIQDGSYSEDHLIRELAELGPFHLEGYICNEEDVHFFTVVLSRRNNTTSSLIYDDMNPIPYVLNGYYGITMGYIFLLSRVNLALEWPNYDD